MIIVLEEEVANIELTEETVMVIETYDFDLPSGIVAGTLTEAGSMIVALGDSYPSETGAPTGDNQVWARDLAEPKKGNCQSLSSGGGAGLLNNKSGIARVTGTVVVLDGSNDKAFTTTTTVADPLVVGVTAEDISANTDGQVKTLGRNTVLVQGNVARGEWLVASATAGRAQAAGTTRPASGAIGIALEAYAGGGAGSIATWVDITPQSTGGGSVLEVQIFS